MYVRVRIRGLELLVFRKILRTYLMNDPLRHLDYFQFRLLLLFQQCQLHWN